MGGQAFKSSITYTDISETIHTLDNDALSTGGRRLFGCRNYCVLKFYVKKGDKIPSPYLISPNKYQNEYYAVVDNALKEQQEKFEKSGGGSSGSTFKPKLPSLALSANTESKAAYKALPTSFLEPEHGASLLYIAPVAFSQETDLLRLGRIPALEHEFLFWPKDKDVKEGEYLAYEYFYSDLRVQSMVREAWSFAEYWIYSGIQTAPGTFFRKAHESGYHYFVYNHLANAVHKNKITGEDERIDDFAIVWGDPAQYGAGRTSEDDILKNDGAGQTPEDYALAKDSEISNSFRINNDGRTKQKVIVNSLWYFDTIWGQTADMVGEFRFNYFKRTQLINDVGSLWTNDAALMFFSYIVVFILLLFWFNKRTKPKRDAMITKHIDKILHVDNPDDELGIQLMKGKYAMKRHEQAAKKLLERALKEQDRHLAQGWDDELQKEEEAKKALVEKEREDVMAMVERDELGRMEKEMGLEQSGDAGGMGVGHIAVPEPNNNFNANTAKVTPLPSDIESPSSANDDDNKVKKSMSFRKSAGVAAVMGVSSLASRGRS